MTIQNAFDEHAEVVLRARALQPALEQAASAAIDCLKDGNKILACGNGGSAIDAQHFVSELVGKFNSQRRALAAISLTANVATVTSVSNEYGYALVFERQVEALARPGDLLLALSTSGDSENVVRAAEAARRVGCLVISLTGSTGGALAHCSDISIKVPSSVVPRIQEVHALLIHILCAAIDASVRDWP